MEQTEKSVLEHDFIQDVNDNIVSTTTKSCADEQDQRKNQRSEIEMASIMFVSLRIRLTFQTPFHKLCEVTLEMAMEEIGLLNSKRLNRIMKRKNACVKIRDFVRQERRRIRNRQDKFSQIIP